MTITAGRTRVEATRPVRLRQLPGLDGLRAIAVVAVIVYHLNPSWLPGGYLGVDIFFVISGYLITSLLLSEQQRTGRVDLRRFWGRRARRLLPALGVLLLVILLLAALFARDALEAMRTDVPASIFYVLNWRLLFEHDSYAASLGRPPLLQHLWSLSVEEQFYLLWPPILLLLRRRFTRTRVAGLALVGAVASAVLMAVLYRPGGNPSAVYFGTETHAQGLLLGCALAAAVPPWRMTAAVAPSARRLLERCGMGAMLLVFAGLVIFGFNSPATYRGGMFLVDLAALVVVATVAHPASRFGAALGRQPFRWLGLRSYSLYLWHWPIFAMTRPGPDLAWSTGTDVILRLALTAAAAELSYRYVERPWRDGRAQFALRVRAASLPRSQVVVAAVAPLAAISLILATAPGPSEPAVLAVGATAAARTALTTAMTGTTEPELPPLWPRPTTRTTYPVATTRATTRKTARTTVPAPRQPSTYEPILALGDSVMLAAAPSLNAAFGPAITVDAAVGRQVGAGLTRLQAYQASGALAHYRTVVIDLGTNGTFSPTQFAQLSAVLAGVPRVVFFDVHVNRPWAAADNATIAQGVAAHRAQMRLVGWNAAAVPGLLYSDGIHPNTAGAATYTRLLQQALAAR